MTVSSNTEKAYQPNLETPKGPLDQKDLKEYTYLKNIGIALCAIGITTLVLGIATPLFLRKIDAISSEQVRMSLAGSISGGAYVALIGLVFALVAHNSIKNLH